APALPPAALAPMALLGLLVLLGLAGPAGALGSSSNATSLTKSGPGVPSGTWPGIVSIQATLENGTWHMCSGALIHPQWVLTVAHCFFRPGDISRWEVVIGATDLTQPGPEVELRHIRRLLVHQHYVATAARNNIALLELAQPVECSDYIQLACVPDSSLAVPELKTCYIAGWRAAPGSGQSPGPRLALQEAKVRLMDAQLCNSSRWYGGALHPQDLCAGYPRGGIDTCQVRAWAQGHRDPRAPNTAPSNPQTQHRDP
uniref:Uncharacterized protein n=1 Tax=Corvus moneduloides TaxID=1196302 RepID=A0A8C3D9J6_CORMO